MRKVVLGLLSVATLAGLVAFTGNGGARAIAGGLTMYDNDMGRFPRKPSKFQSTDEITFGGVPIELVSLDLSGPTNAGGSVLLPADGASAQVASSFDGVVGLRTGGTTEHHLCGVTNHFLVVGDGPGGGGSGGGVWPIEILAMQLSGNGFRLRESPTLKSTGHYRLTPLAGGGGYTVDSFFDVFTEISLDGGMSWNPAYSALRLNLTSIVPEPATAMLAILVFFALGFVHHRNRRRQS
jgi:hypothetical protein